MTYQTPAAEMSKAQHKALTRASKDPRGFVERADGVSSSTIIGLAHVDRQWATLEFEVLDIGGREVKRLCGATITGLGRRELVLVDAEKAQAAKDGIVRRLGATSRVDPFVLVQVQYAAEQPIPF